MAEDIWCCVRINTFASRFTEDQCEILVESIGTREFATEYCDANTARGNVKKIGTEDAWKLIADDILEHDNEGMRQGNWLRGAANRKLKQKMGEKL